jgi:hypothetical protein
MPHLAGGAVLHPGPRSFDLDDRLIAAPIAALRTRPKTPWFEARTPADYGIEADVTAVRRT